VYEDGDCEEASFISRAGKATVTYSNGDVYQGTFNAQRKKHGKGTYTWNVTGLEERNATLEDGDEPFKQEYTGDWKHGRKHGIGTMTYPNGESYSGYWHQGKRQGRGAYRYKNGDIYSGDWANGQRSGQGTYSYANDNMISGDWEEGGMTVGVWTMADGTRFMGQFRNSVPDGEGVFEFKATGVKQKGDFTRMRTAEQASKGQEGTLQWNGEQMPL
jgi:hypothetical protein